jgi:hypothetical protein
MAGTTSGFIDLEEVHEAHVVLGPEPLDGVVPVAHGSGPPPNDSPSRPEGTLPDSDDGLNDLTARLSGFVRRTWPWP